MIIPIFISDKTADAVGDMIDEVLGDVLGDVPLLFFTMIPLMCWIIVPLMNGVISGSVGLGYRVYFGDYVYFKEFIHYLFPTHQLGVWIGINISWAMDAIIPAWVIFLFSCFGFGWWLGGRK